MSALYILFALIPIAALVMSLFPEFFGKNETVAAGGFEYSLFLSKKWLFCGSVLTSASGILFVLILDKFSSLETWFAMLFLAVLFVFSVVGIVLVAFYLGYKLTVRGNTMLYKLPFKREISVSFCDISRYKTSFLYLRRTLRPHFLRSARVSNRMLRTKSAFRGCIYFKYVILYY